VAGLRQAALNSYCPSVLARHDAQDCSDAGHSIIASAHQFVILSGRNVVSVLSGSECGRRSPPSSDCRVDAELRDVLLYGIYTRSASSPGYLLVHRTTLGICAFGSLVPNIETDALTFYFNPIVLEFFGGMLLARVAATWQFPGVPCGVRGGTRSAAGPFRRTVSAFHRKRRAGPARRVRRGIRRKMACRPDPQLPAQSWRSLLCALSLSSHLFPGGSFGYDAYGPPRGVDFDRRVCYVFNHNFYDCLRRC